MRAQKSCSFAIGHLKAKVKSNLWSFPRRATSTRDKRGETAASNPTRLTPGTVLVSRGMNPFTSSYAWRSALNAPSEDRASVRNVIGTKKLSDARTALFEAERRLSGIVNMAVNANVGAQRHAAFDVRHGTWT